MARAESTSAIEKATNRSWSDWVLLLAEHGKDHQSLVACALANMPENFDKKHWWSQAVAVAYEQQIGRRKPGQRLDGSYEVAVSKTVTTPQTELSISWIDYFKSLNQINDHTPTNARTSSTDIRDYLRADVGVYKFESAIEAKTDQKSLLVVTMSELESEAVRSQWQDYWKSKLQEFVNSL